MSAMDVMLHSSSFLLPSNPVDDTTGTRYALIVLNQSLPRFAPLLWEHGTDDESLYSSEFMTLFFFVGFRFIYLVSNFCVEQQNFVSVLMEALIASTTNYLSSSLMKTLWPFETGLSLSLSHSLKSDTLSSEFGDYYSICCS